MICWTGLPLLEFSCTTSSICKSSRRPCSRSRLRTGWFGSAILRGGSGRFGRFHFLELGQDRAWILRFGDHFVLGNQTSVVFVQEEAVERNHSVFCAGLNVRINTER